MGHPPRVPIRLRWEQSVIYFVTICVNDRKKVLANEQAFCAFKNATKKLSEWTVLAAILMPDHLHIIVSPNKDRDAKIGNFSAAIKRWMRQQLRASWRWQPGFFDRLLRSDESLHEKWLYLQENPVRAGLAKHWQDWPYRYEFKEPAVVGEPHRLTPAKWQAMRLPYNAQPRNRAIVGQPHRLPSKSLNR
jgi:putative transposase